MSNKRQLKISLVNIVSDTIGLFRTPSARPNAIDIVLQLFETHGHNRKANRKLVSNLVARSVWNLAGDEALLTR